jgi:hypothetical protein
MRYLTRGGRGRIYVSVYSTVTKMADKVLNTGAFDGAQNFLQISSFTHRRSLVFVSFGSPSMLARV